MSRRRERPKAGRPIDTSMSGSTPKPVVCSETISMAGKCPAGVFRHRERERFDRQ